MGIMDGWRAKRQDRAKEMAEDARDVMDSVESPYTAARSSLSEYEKAVRFRPGSAYRHAKRAYRKAVDESEAARTHTMAAEVLEAQKRTDERRISSMDSDYRSNLAKGRTRKATKIANRMYVEASSNPDPSPVSVTIDRSGLDEGSIDVIVTNRGDRPVVIDAISCSCGSTELMSQTGMSEACQPGQQTRRAVTFDQDVSLGVTVFVEYQCGFETSKIRRQFSLIKQV